MNYAEELQRVFQLRESGEFAQALQALIPIKVSATLEGQTTHLVTIGMEGASNNRHLYLQTQAELFLHAAWFALEEAEDFVTAENKVAFTFWRAQILLSQKRYPKAEELYSASLELLDSESPQAGNYQYHLGVAEFLAGKREAGLQRLQAGIENLQKNQANLPPYEYHVWLSGAYLRLAQLQTLAGEKEQALAALEQAATVIGNRPDLVIRQKHLEKTRDFVDQSPREMETLF